MILADTSLWVDHLRDADTPATAGVRDLLTTSFSELAICEPMELIAGGPPEPRLTRLVGSPKLRRASKTAARRR